MHSCRFNRRIYFVEAAPAPSFDGQKSNVATLKGLSFEPFQNCIITVIQIFFKVFRVKDYFFLPVLFFCVPPLTFITPLRPLHPSSALAPPTAFLSYSFILIYPLSSFKQPLFFFLLFILTSIAVPGHSTVQTAIHFPACSHVKPTSSLSSHCAHFSAHLLLAPCWPPQRRQVAASRTDSSIMIRMCGSLSRVASVCATVDRFCAMR